MTFDPNAHGEFVHLPGIGNAFIDGIPDKCEHDDSGPVLAFNEAGEYFKHSDMPDYFTDYEGWLKFQKDHKINGGCVSCSKCGKPFSPPMFDI